MFSELLGSVVWCLTLISGSSHSHCFSCFFYSFLSSFSSGFSITYYIFRSCLTGLEGCTAFFHSLLSLLFTLGGLYWGNQARGLLPLLCPAYEADHRYSSFLLQHSWSLAFLFGFSLVAQMVKNPPAMQETWVRSLGQEDPREKGMTTRSSILALRTPWTEKLAVHGVAKSWTGLSGNTS